MKIQRFTITLSRAETKRYEDSGPAGDTFRREVRSVARARADRYLHAITLFASMSEGGWVAEHVEPSSSLGEASGRASGKQPCACGSPDAGWHGDEHGLRTYSCDACYRRMMHGSPKRTPLVYEPPRPRKPLVYEPPRGHSAGASALSTIRPGDRVTILVHAGGIGRNVQWKEATGRAVMRGDYGWVLDMGGRHGTPGIASEENLVRVRHARSR